MSSQTSLAGGVGTLILVRHGETEGQSSIRYYGRTDIALSEEGREHMRAAAHALAGEDFTRLFASSLRRATEGARIIAGDNVPIVSIAEFVEIDFGRFEGKTIDEIRRDHPEEFERWQHHRFDPGYQYPGGESGAAFRARVTAGMERMFESWRDGQAEVSGSALLVAHRGVIRVILDNLFPGTTADIVLGSIHILDFNRGWHVRALDITSHLAATV
jgi:broad specificity phosphatase PhoE